MTPELLPEDSDRVAAFDAALRRDPGRVRAAAESFLAECTQLGITPLPGAGLPLRPFFLSRARMTRLAAVLHGAAQRLGALFRDHLADRARLEALVAVRPQHLTHLDLGASFESPQLYSLMRPDGFLFGDAYSLTELNLGNGVLLSALYTETLRRLYCGHLNLLGELGWSAEPLMLPFRALMATLRAHAGVERPRVAVLSPIVDSQDSDAWGERVHQHFGWAPALMREEGIDAVVVNERQLALGPGGELVTEDGQRVDLVFLMTTGLGFLCEPQALEHRGVRFGGARVGHAPFLAPVATLLFDKGALPALARTVGDAFGEEGARVVLPRTCFPDELDPARLRLEKDRFVIKRAVMDKHTVVGVSTEGRAWNRMLEPILGTRDYVVQEYRSMPRATVPVLLDGHLEWIEVRVEVSPFIFDGRLCGVMTRYAPDAEGIVMSPPPEGMGFGLSYLT